VLRELSIRSVFGLAADSLAEVCAAQPKRQTRYVRRAAAKAGVQWVIIITLQFTVMAILHTLTRQMSDDAFRKSHAA
jgi:hypothetical protein